MNIRSNYNRIGALALLLCALSLPTISSAQQVPAFAPCQGGTTYIIAFPDTVQNKVDSRFRPTLPDKAQIFMYAATDTKVRISNGNGAPTFQSLKGGAVGLFQVTVEPFTTQVNTPNNKPLRIEAEQPIIVYCYFATKFGGEAFTAIPVEAWGTEYALASTPGETVLDATPASFKLSTEKVPAPEEALIIAAYDNTNVSVVPTGKLVGQTKPIRITLNANEAYLVQSFVDTTEGATPTTIAGSRIIADRPIGVISGNTRAQVTDQDGITRNSFKNAMIEWLTPTDQHGTKFVYLPTWDANRRTGDPNEIAADKRQAEFVRIYSTVDDRENSGSYIGTSDSGSFTIPASGGTEGYNFYEHRQEAPVALYFQTDAPAMAMMNSSAVVRFSGTIASPGGTIGAAYDTKGASYMVEMTPREQWVNFAPFYPPIYPPNMNHYINVVTDTLSMNKVVYKVGAPGQGAEQKFIFNRGVIPGSDLVWGTMQVVPGDSYYLRGLDSSARFYGFVYGMLKGYELLRPSGLSEYEENVALAYGYPLAPSRCVLAPSDSLGISLQQTCRQLGVKIATLNSNPVGLRSIMLEEGSTNSVLNFIDPVGGPGAILHKTNAEIIVRPIDPHLDAEATIVIMDRTGKQTHIPYSYTAERLDFSPGTVLDFGEVNLKAKSGDSIVTICNPLDSPLTVTDIRLAFGSQKFELVDTNTLPMVLVPKGCLQVSLSITPTIGNKLYEDSLIVTTTCNESSIRLRAASATPCIYVDDLSFGSLDLADSSASKGKTLSLKICNQGRGTIYFQDQGSGLLSWLDQNHFTVDQESLALLATTVLGPDECVTIPVTFIPTEVGVFRTVGHIWANTRNCRDTSVWSATVIHSTTDAPSTGNAVGYSLRGNLPNPFTGITRIEFSLGRSAPTRVEIFDATGQRLTTLADETMSAGPHRMLWDASSIPSGIYFCRVSSGSWSRSIPMTLLR